MPNWNEILDEIRKHGSTFDLIRRKYLAKLQRLTGRNVICYYSGWLQKPGLMGAMIDDNDKNGLMTTINKLDRSKGLTLSCTPQVAKRRPLNQSWTTSERASALTCGPLCR